MNPYLALGLPKTCTTREVRAAFRRLAKTHHPDAGGDPETFATIKLAHDILIDADRRAHWDATGRDKAPESNSLDQMAQGVLAGVLEMVLTQADEPWQHDLVVVITNHLQKGMESTRQAIKNYNRVIERAERMLTKWHPKKGSDSTMILDILRWRTENLRLSLRGLDQSIKVSERAIEILKGWKFDKEQMTASVYMYPPSAGQRFSTQQTTRMGSW